MDSNDIILRMPISYVVNDSSKAINGIYSQHEGMPYEYDTLFSLKLFRTRPVIGFSWLIRELKIRRTKTIYCRHHFTGFIQEILNIFSCFLRDRQWKMTECEVITCKAESVQIDENEWNELFVDMIAPYMNNTRSAMEFCGGQTQAYIKYLTIAETSLTQHLSDGGFEFDDTCNMA